MSWKNSWKNFKRNESKGQDLISVDIKTSSTPQQKGAGRLWIFLLVGKGGLDLAQLDVFFEDAPVFSDFDVAFATDQHQGAVGAEIAVPLDDLFV